MVVESVGSVFVFGELWVSPLSYRGVPGQTKKSAQTAKIIIGFSDCDPLILLKKINY